MSRNKMPKGRPPSRRNGRAPADRGAAHNPNDRRHVAAHEAGHAVAAVVLNLDWVGVDIRRRILPGGGVSLGFTECPTPVPVGDRDGRLAMARPYMTRSLAGPLGEMLVNPVVPVGAFDDDAQSCHRLATIALCDQTKVGSTVTIEVGEQRRREAEIAALMAERMEAARALVNAHRVAILAVAEVLLERTALTAAQVAAIVAAHPPRPASV